MQKTIRDKHLDLHFLDKFSEADAVTKNLKNEGLEEHNEENYGMYISVKEALHESVNKLYDYYNKNPSNSEKYLNSGFRNLYFKKGDLIILAARSSLSSFTSCLLYNVVMKKRKPVGYITCGEKDAANVCTRLISVTTGISLYKILEGHLKKEDVERISERAKQLYAAPLFINETPNCCFEQFELAVRLMVEQQKIEAVFVDSFEYLEEIVNADKEELPYIQADVLENYKEIARQYNIPVVILMHLPDRDDDYSEISDFKKNMCIPRIADQVYLLQKERIPENLIEDKATLITAKNAHGINLRIPLKYNPGTGVYKSAEENE